MRDIPNSLFEIMVSDGRLAKDVLRQRLAAAKARASSAAEIMDTAQQMVDSARKNLHSSREEVRVVEALLKEAEERWVDIEICDEMLSPGDSSKRRKVSVPPYGGIIADHCTSGIGGAVDLSNSPNLIGLPRNTMPYGYQWQTAGAARIAAEAEVARVAAEAEVARIAAEEEAARCAAEAEVARIAAAAEAAMFAAEAEVARITPEAEAARKAEAGVDKGEKDKLTDSQISKYETMMTEYHSECLCRRLLDVCASSD